MTADSFVSTHCCCCAAGPPDSRMALCCATFSCLAHTVVQQLMLPTHRLVHTPANPKNRHNTFGLCTRRIYNAHRCASLSHNTPLQRDVSTLTSSEVQLDHPRLPVFLFGTLSCTDWHFFGAVNLIFFRCQTSQTCHRLPQHALCRPPVCDAAFLPNPVQSLEV